MHTILVADYDKSFNEILSSKVNREENCKVVATVYDGKSAIAAIEAKRPDIIIIDFILPEADGLYVIEHVRSSLAGYDPIIYALSCIGNELILDRLNALGVDFFNMKPVSFDIILHNLRSLAGGTHDRKDVLLFPQREALRDRIRDMAIRFGLLPHRLSTKCIIDAVMYYVENSNDVQVLTKTLYPEIAKKHNITGYAVEKNIRAGIEVMRKANTPFFNEVFAYAGDKRVTNGEFLAMAADHLGKAPVYSRV